MTHEEFTGVSVNDLDPPETRRSLEFFVVKSTEIALINIPHKRIFYESGD